MKNKENNKKNIMINEKLKKFPGWIKKIKIKSFPSLPPIILNENKIKDIMVIKKK
jgi:hypothetical protein